jgi:PhnO protein
MLTLRRAGEDDAESVHHLIGRLEESEQFPYEPFLQTYLKNLRDPDIIYLVAEDEGDVIAFGSLAFSAPLHHTAPVAEIIELIVDDRSRGRSVGAQLVNAMMLLARDRGCCCLEVASNRVRKRAHHFYARHGFMMTHYKLTLKMGFRAE